MEFLKVVGAMLVSFAFMLAVAMLSYFFIESCREEDNHKYLALAGLALIWITFSYYLYTTL